jgi:hypothetical protein
MPILDNPRWERFAQLIVSYVAKPGEPNSKGKLYAQSGYNAKGVGQDGGSAEVAASRLFKYVQVQNRVQELLAEAAKNTKVTIESITDEYNEARELAKTLDNTSVMLAASQAKAKLYKLETTVIENVNSEASMPKNSREVALSLLADVGLSEPSDEAIERALEAFDVMNAKLEAIRDESLGLTTYQHRPHAPISKHEH